MKQLLLLCWLLCCGSVVVMAQFGSPYTNDFNSPEVTELSGEPSFRAVKLRWRSPRYPDASSFHVKVCEVSVWGNGKTRCRERNLSLEGGTASDYYQSHDTLTRVNVGRFEAVINDLRMTTNYTFAVTPDVPANTPIFFSGNDFGQPATGSGHPHRARNILVTTSGFTARAARCLSNTSDVVVNTGPYFNGKISVEETPDERCAVKGNKTSQDSVYTLTILHDLCGSRTVNNSRIETNIIVHENSDIVTHNSKRFMVVCNFLPETFTIKASVSMPKRTKSSKGRPDLAQEVGRRGGVSRGAEDGSAANDLYPYHHDQRANHVRDSRILAEQTSKLEGLDKRDNRMFGQLSILILLAVGAICGCGVAIWWFVHGSGDRKEPDVTSAIAGSCVTVTKDSRNDKQLLVTPEGSSLEPREDLLRVSVCGRPVALMTIKPIGDSEA